MGYPTVFLFRNGTHVKEYTGAREIAPLLDFVDEESAQDKSQRRVHLAEIEALLVVASPTTPLTPQPPPPVRPPVPELLILPSVPEPMSLPLARLPPPPPLGVASRPRGGDGTSVSLDGVGLAKAILASKSSGGLASMVKFYAPWCHHCKEFQPKWDQVAASLRAGQSPVQFYEVDCTSAINQGVCAQEQVKGYPTVFWYHNGIKVEYDLPREVSQLEVWIAKMVIASRSGTIAAPTSESDLRELVQQSPVSMIFLHPEAQMTAAESVRSSDPSGSRRDGRKANLASR